MKELEYLESQILYLLKVSTFLELLGFLGLGFSWKDGAA